MDKSANSSIIYDFNAQSLKDAVYARKSQVNSDNFRGVPATIVGVDDYEELQCIAVKISINDIHLERDNLVLESVTIPKVFVSLPNTGGFMWKQPVKVGDMVRLAWSHRDLGDYLDGDGSNVDLSIEEVSQLEDCWCTLDGGTRKNNTKPSLTDLILEGPKTIITITPEGIVSLETESDITVVTKTKAHVEASESITLKAPTITADGNFIVTGTSELQRLATLKSGSTMLGTVTLDGITLNTHTHIESGGGTTNPMQ